MFFTTVFVGDLYKANNPSLTPQDEDATRAGTKALFWSAVVALISTLLCPRLIRKTVSQPSEDDDEDATFSGVNVGLVQLWAVSHAVFALTMFCMA